VRVGLKTQCLKTVDRLDELFDFATVIAVEVTRRGEGLRGSDDE
jgi:hypothetical protein